VKRLALAAALVALATLPLWVGNTFYVNIATQILLYAVFALGINVLVGYAGLVTLGHAGLFGTAPDLARFAAICRRVRDPRTGVCRRLIDRLVHHL
jgi:branched-chain amino acid transport system permease protein